MTDGTVIRAATIDDVEALADVYVSSARHHSTLDPEFYTVPDRDAVVGHLRKALNLEDDARVVRLVAEVAGRVIASVELDASAANADALRFYEKRHGYRLRGC